MKSLTALFATAVILLAGADDSQTHSVLSSKNSGPVLLDPGPIVTRSVQETVLEQPIIDETMIQESLPATPTIVGNPHLDNPVLIQPPVVHAPAAACTECRIVTCCRKSKTHSTAEFELIDPSGCVHIACAKVPVCCTNEAPVVSWKCRRLLGRQVATLCWECCDHEVKVIITRRGKVKVRD